MFILSLLLYVLVFCVVIWAIRYLMATFSIPEQIQAVVTVVIVVVFVIWIVSLLASGVQGPVLRVR